MKDEALKSGADVFPQLGHTLGVRRLLAWLPASLSTHLGAQRHGPRLPERVQQLIVAEEEQSERLVSWAQLLVVATFTTLYFAAPKPADAALTMFQPVPMILAPYLVWTVARLILTYRRFMPGWFLVLSMLIDVTMLWALVWSFHLDYAQPAAFYLKVPTFIYIFVFIAIRALRFDPRFVLSMGAFAAMGWALMVGYALVDAGQDGITRSFVTYLTSATVLLGAEFDKIFTIVVVTSVLALAIRRARHLLFVAVREEAAGRDLRRFVAEGVADAVTASEQQIAAGRAESWNAATLMLDIRGFTRFSTDREPQDVVDMLVTFHARALPIIRTHGGVIDKFLGDGVMATFGAVAPMPRAAAGALASLEAILDEARRWPEGERLGLRVNGAVAAGPVVFAALGHDNRLEYTVIGESVNLAAKLEKHNKSEGSQGLTTAACYRQAVAEGFEARLPIEELEARTVSGIDGSIDLVAVAAMAGSHG